GAGPPVAEGCERGGVGWVRVVSVGHRPASRSRHPRPRQIPCRTLVRGGDDRGPSPPPTHRPTRIPAGVRTGHLPVPLPAVDPLRPPVRRPHPSLGAGPGRPARTGSGLAEG